MSPVFSVQSRPEQNHTCSYFGSFSIPLGPGGQGSTVNIKSSQFRGVTCVQYFVVLHLSPIAIFTFLLLTTRAALVKGLQICIGSYWVPTYTDQDYVSLLPAPPKPMQS